MQQNLNLSVRPYIVIGLLLLIGQIILGGWTSSNYAALACPDFPLCQGQWWPDTDFGEGFVFWRGLGTNYEFGVLENPARTAIHLSHRLLAVVVAIYWLILLSRVFIAVNATKTLRKVAGTTLFLLLVQLTLGISNIVLHLPITVAVMHNGGAALLLSPALWAFATPATTRRSAGARPRDRRPVRCCPTSFRPPLRRRRDPAVGRARASAASRE